MGLIGVRGGVISLIINPLQDNCYVLYGYLIPLSKFKPLSPK